MDEMMMIKKPISVFYLLVPVAIVRATEGENIPRSKTPLNYLDPFHPLL